MLILNRAVLAGAVLAVTTAAGVLAGAHPVLAVAAGAPGGGNGCYTFDNIWICVYSGSSGGRPGSAGSRAYTCTYAPASEVILQMIGAGKPDPGHQWDIMTCPGPHSGPGALVEVSTKAGVPRIAPARLLKIAIGELTVPALAADTAPPRGADGLVGLPEWFWVPSAQWQSTSVTVRAGPVWATATATPTTLSYSPGGGLGPVSCHGPGTPFGSGTPAGAAHTACSYTYAQPSAGQPGSTYHAALVVHWTISWTGSGGAGGVVTTGYTTQTAFGVRVAQAEALVTRP